MLKINNFVRVTLTRNIRNVSTATIITGDETGETGVKPYEEIPGPRSWPIMGTFLEYLPGGRLFKKAGMEIFEHLHREYGPIVRLEGTFGGNAMVSLTDPDSAAMIFRGEHLTPTRNGVKSLVHYRKEYKRSKGYPEKNTGLSTEQYEKWREFRTVVNPVLMDKKKFNNWYTEPIDEISKEMVNRLRSLRNDKNMLEGGKFDYEMNLWALESTGLVALGSKLNCLQLKLEKNSPEKKLVQCIHEFFSVMDEMDFQPSLWRYFATPLYKRAMAIYENQEKLCKFFVDRAMASYQSAEALNADNKISVLRNLMAVNPEVAYTMASDLLLGGVDTISTTMILALYNIAINQDKQDKLREEVLSSSNDLRYLRACIKESFRILPVTSANVRETNKEYGVLGYRIPKHTQCIFMNKIMCLNPEQFPEPEKFIPERWIVEKDNPLSAKNAHPFALLPFGFGARQCIGRRLSELQLETFLMRIFQNFKIEWNGPPIGMRYAGGLNYTKPPYHFVYKNI